MGRRHDDWRAALLLAYQRGRTRGETVADVRELAASPEGMAALGLTAALVRVCTTAHDQRVVADAAVRGDLDAPSGHEAAPGSESGYYITDERAREPLPRLPPVMDADEDTRRALLREHLLARRPPEPEAEEDPAPEVEPSPDGGEAAP